MKKILVIDDEEWLREMVHMALRQKGFDVIEAENGAVGIEKARKELPDLILCDVNMEKVDGYLTLSALRSEPTTAAIPFILMTGLADNAGHAPRHGTGRGRLPAQALHHRGALRRRGRPAQEGPGAAPGSREEAGRFARQHQPDAAARDAHPLNGILAYGEILARAPRTCPRRDRRDGPGDLPILHGVRERQQLLVFVENR